jgi:imidazolonepropionase-like amidohydrolase
MIALDGGVDIIAHTAPEDGRAWSADTIRRMLAAHLALIPTLKLWKYELQRQRGGMVDWAHNAFMLTAQQQLRDFSKAGGTVLFGTDVGYVPDYSTGDEYTLLAGSGLDFSHILAALTTTPAQRFGLDARTGRIAVGMDADIVLLAADPALDIRSFDRVVYTFCQGKIVYQNIPPETPVR